VQALPAAAYFLFLEVAVGGAIALFWVHLRGAVGRGFTLFTGVIFWVAAALAVWLRAGFPPVIVGGTQLFWFAAERALALAFVIVFGIYLLGLRFARAETRLPSARSNGAVHAARPGGPPLPAARGLLSVLAPLVPLLGLGALWSAALIEPGPQLGGLGAPLAALIGALALGTALTGLSLGHWYLVTPGMSVRPLVELTLACLAALVAQCVLLPLLLWLPGTPPAGLTALFGAYALFLGVRVIFGLLVPLAAAFMTWRTARIRSLDSATGLLYIMAALVLAGEITARTLFFLTGVAT
jgi:hypothetical protein